MVQENQAKKRDELTRRDVVLWAFFSVIFTAVFWTMIGPPAIGVGIGIGIAMTLALRAERTRGDDQTPER